MESNIFIFSLDSGLEIPFHRYFSARRFDLNAPSVTIIRIDEKRAEPTYHLVISRLNDEKQGVWSPAITKDLAMIYHNLNRVYMRSKKIYMNIFSLDFCPPDFEPVAQILDEAGKCRGLVDREKKTIMFYPSQPYNLPRGEVHPVPFKSLSMEEQPTAISVADGEIIGLWFTRYDIPNCIFIPVNIRKHEEYSKLPILPSLYVPKLVDPQKKFEKDYYTLRMIFHLLRWLNYLAGDQKRSDRSLISDKILDHLLVVQDFNPEFNLRRSLPRVTTMIDAIMYIKSTTKGFITGEGGAYFINLPSKKIINYLEAALQRNNTEWTMLPNYIPNFYAYRSDFGSQTFLSPEELYTYLAEDTKFDTNLNLKKTEGVYTPKLLVFENQIFLYIQKRGLSFKERLHETAKLFEEIRGVKVRNNYMIYGISVDDGALIAVENKTGQEPGSESNFLTLIDDGLLIPLL